MLRKSICDLGFALDVQQQFRTEGIRYFSSMYNWLAIFLFLVSPAQIWLPMTHQLTLTAVLPRNRASRGHPT